MTKSPPQFCHTHDFVVATPPGAPPGHFSMPPRGSSPVARRAVSLPWRGLVARSPLKCMARNARRNFPNKIHHAVSMQDSYWRGVRPRHRARPPAPQRRNAACRSRPRRPACESALHDGGKRGGPMGAGAMSGFLGLPVRAAQSRLRANYEPPSICYEPLRADLSEFGTESLIIQHGELCTGHWALALGNYCIHPSFHARRHGRPACAANAPPTRRLRAAYVPPTCRLRAAYVPPIICYVPLRSGSEDFRFRTLRGRHVAARSK